MNFNTLGISDGSHALTHTADEHTPRSKVEDTLSIGGCQGTKQKSPNMENSGCCACTVPHTFHVKDDAMHFKTYEGWVGLRC